MTLSDAISIATGISDPFILDAVTGILFIVGTGLIIGSLFKSFFRFV